MTNKKICFTVKEVQVLEEIVVNILLCDIFIKVNLLQKYLQEQFTLIS